MTADIESRRAQLRSDVSIAGRLLPTHYPLETFIAVNPLAGLEGMPFEQAFSSRQPSATSESSVWSADT